MTLEEKIEKIKALIDAKCDEANILSQNESTKFVKMFLSGEIEGLRLALQLLKGE